MAKPDDELQSWFDGLSYKVKRELAQAIKDEADGLADAIKQAAPAKSGALRDSVKVRRKKNDLDLEVTAGGDATTREVRAGSGVPYDYARAVEFGTVNAEAEPFFYSTYRERAPEIRENIEAAVERAINS
ncbi:HK97-gp10 family putative phage morphogenesis protein [Bradyrhizobium sp. USDA 4452]